MQPATDADSCEALLDRALARRKALLTQTSALRLFHSLADGIEGFVLERFGDVLVAQLHEGRLGVHPDNAQSLCDYARIKLAGRAVYRKIFAGDRSAASARLDTLHRDPTPWLGAPTAEEFTILENAQHHRIRPFDGYSVGLFLEHRDNRARVRETSRGRSVLNTFAYTCGFSVAAALGGAAATVSVDASKRYLEWGKRNFAANGLALDDHRFICSDVLDYFRRAARQDRRFDTIILDPPTFGRDKKSGRVFSIADDLDALVSAALDRLNPGGLTLLATNHRGTSLPRLEQALRRTAGGRRVHITDRPPLPADFPGDPDYAKSLWASVE